MIIRDRSVVKTPGSAPLRVEQWPDGALRPHRVAAVSIGSERRKTDPSSQVSQRAADNPKTALSNQNPGLPHPVCHESTTLSAIQSQYNFLIGRSKRGAN